MNNRRFNLENEENQDNRDRMGIGMFLLILLALPLQFYLVGQGTIMISRSCPMDL